MVTGDALEIPAATMGTLESRCEVSLQDMGVENSFSTVDSEHPAETHRLRERINRREWSSELITLSCKTAALSLGVQCVSEGTSRSGIFVSSHKLFIAPFGFIKAQNTAPAREPLRDVK